MVDVRILEDSKYQNWDNFLKRNFPANIFSRSKWITSLAGSGKSKPAIIACCFDNEIIAGVAGAVSKRFGVSILEPPVFTPYNGLLIRENIGDKINSQSAVDDLFSFLRNKYDRLIISYYPNKEVSQPRRSISLIQYTRFTSIIDLSPGEMIKQSFLPDIKNKINKSIRAGMNVTEEFNPDQLFALLMKVQARTGHKIRLDKSSFFNSLNDFSKNGWLRLFFGVLGGNYCSVSAIISYKNTCYSWLSATDPDYFRSGIGPGLLSHVLLKLSGEGFRTFDFMGINLPGVGRFKEAFGGKRISYSVHDFAFSLKSRIYRVAQKLRRN